MTQGTGHGDSLAGVARRLLHVLESSSDAPGSLLHWELVSEYVVEGLALRATTASRSPATAWLPDDLRSAMLDRLRADLAHWFQLVPLATALDGILPVTEVVHYGDHLPSIRGGLADCNRGRYSNERLWAPQEMARLFVSELEQTAASEWVSHSLEGAAPGADAARGYAWRWRRRPAREPAAHRHADRTDDILVSVAATTASGDQVAKELRP